MPVLLVNDYVFGMQRGGACPGVELGDKGSDAERRQRDILAPSCQHAAGCRAPRKPFTASFFRNHEGGRIAGERQLLAASLRTFINYREARFLESRCRSPTGRRNGGCGWRAGGSSGC